MTHLDDAEERLVGRLEAFSDVVIGFSLAQCGAQLAVPAAGHAFHIRPFTLIAFLVTFGTICGMWWSHHKLFSRFFVPLPACIVMNFASLAGVIFVVYSLQIWLTAGSHDSRAYAMYFAAFGAVCGLLAAEYAIGIRQRGDRMEQATLREGRRTLLRLAGLTVIFAFSAAAVLRFGIRSPYAIWLPVLFVLWQRGLYIYWKRRDRLTTPQPATADAARR